MAFIRRKRKGESYYYELVESIWEEGKPKQKIIEYFPSLKAARPLPEQALKNLKEKFEIDMTYNSNAIEGNRLTLRETWLVIRKGITIGGKSLEEHLEAKNHLEALHFLYELVG